MEKQKIDVNEKARVERYLDNLKEDALKQIAIELYFYGELGHKTIRTMAEEFDKMYGRGV